MGKAKRRRLRRKKGSQPRLAVLGGPFQGKGLAWTLPPSYGRRCPEGAEVGWGWRCEKERGRSSQVRRLRKHPIHCWRGHSSPMGKAKRRRLRRKKGSQPRLAALGSPFQGKGLAWTLPLSYGEGCETRMALSPTQSLLLGCQYPFFLSTSFMSFSPRAKATKFIWRRLVSLSQKSGTMEAMCGVMMTLSICQKG